MDSGHIDELSVLNRIGRWRSRGRRPACTFLGDPGRKSSPSGSISRRTRATWRWRRRPWAYPREVQPGGHAIRTTNLGREAALSVAGGDRDTALPLDDGAVLLVGGSTRHHLRREGLGAAGQGAAAGGHVGCQEIDEVPRRGPTASACAASAAHPCEVGRILWLVAYSDSELARCVVSRRSASRCVLGWGRHCLRAVSGTQKVIATSSAEEEFYAEARRASAVLGACRLLADLGVQVHAPLPSMGSIGGLVRAGAASGQSSIWPRRHSGCRRWCQGRSTTVRIWPSLAAFGRPTPGSQLPCAPLFVETHRRRNRQRTLPRSCGAVAERSQCGRGRQCRTCPPCLGVRPRLIAVWGRKRLRTFRFFNFAEHIASMASARWSPGSDVQGRYQTTGPAGPNRLQGRTEILVAPQTHRGPSAHAGDSGGNEMSVPRLPIPLGGLEPVRASGKAPFGPPPADHAHGLISVGLRALVRQASARPASAFNGSDAGLGNVSGEVVPGALCPFVAERCAYPALRLRRTLLPPQMCASTRVGVVVFAGLVHRRCGSNPCRSSLVGQKHVLTPHLAIACSSSVVGRSSFVIQRMRGVVRGTWHITCM